MRPDLDILACRSDSIPCIASPPHFLSSFSIPPNPKFILSISIIIIIRQYASYLLDAPVSGADSVANREATPTTKLDEGGEAVWNFKYRLVFFL